MLKLQELRKDMGLNMRQASAQLEISYNTYMSYENGTKEPDISTLIKMADFFDCSVDRLLGRKSKVSCQTESKQYENKTVLPVRSVQMKRVIETVLPLGLGNPGDPARDIVQYWDLDGTLLGEIEKY